MLVLHLGSALRPNVAGRLEPMLAFLQSEPPSITDPPLISSVSHCLASRNDSLCLGSSASGHSFSLFADVSPPLFTSLYSPCFCPTLSHLHPQQSPLDVNLCMLMIQKFRIWNSSIFTGLGPIGPFSSEIVLIVPPPWDRKCNHPNCICHLPPKQHSPSL